VGLSDFGITRLTKQLLSEMFLQVSLLTLRIRTPSQQQYCWHAGCFPIRSRDMSGMDIHAHGPSLQNDPNFMILSYGRGTT